MADVKNDVNYVEKANVDYTDVGLHNKTLNEDTRTATAAEHSLGLWQAIKTYKKAVFWSVMVSTSIVMEGYDTTLIGSSFAYPAFQKKYGFYAGPKNGYQLTSAWQTGLQDGGAIGNIIGALLNGYFAPKHGHRKVMLVNLVAMTTFIFVNLSSPRHLFLLYRLQLVRSLGEI